MTNLKLAAASSLVIAASLAGCSSGHESGMQHHMAEANYMPSGTYRSNTDVGQAMTTPDGMTVYTFDKDSTGASSCYGECAEEWRPVAAPSSAQAFGNMSIIERTDGTRQWAYSGKPLYLYHDDTAPGDAEGDGEGGVWHVVR